MIELSGVTRRYGRRSGTKAVSDISLTIPPGVVWGVVGPNGAGKSTLLSLILGFIRPTQGTVRIAGDRPRDYLRDFGAAWLPERFTLPSSWRAGDALRMLGRLEGIDEAGLRHAVEQLGLDAHLAKRSRELSRGLLQRVGIAQALLAPRDLVVLDEPTEGLDPVWRIRLRDIVRGMRADSRTILIASHDLAELERIADSVIVLEDGRVRDVLEVRSDAEPVEYRVRLAAPFARIHDSFPDATARDGTTYMVRVTGAPELTERLSALIAAGATIAAVEPLPYALEDRVRAALDDGRSDA